MTRGTFDFKRSPSGSDHDPALTVVVEDDPDIAALGAEWQALEARADGSFFTSWTWIAALLANGLVHPRVVRVEAAGRLVAIGIFHWRARWFSRSLSLTSVDDPEYDAPYVEHNGPLVDRDCPEASGIWWQAIGRLGASVVYLPGIAPEALPGLRRLGTVLVERRQPAPRRSLAPVRACGGDVTALMSPNSRRQIRRAIRACEQSGPLTLERATTLDEARLAFARMADLHRAGWRRRGQAGAMSPLFCRFHRDVLAQGVAAGTADLLTVRAGDRLIGHLYNFRYRRTVSAYQSGFAYDTALPHEKPGLVCHALAIRHYAAEGLEIYDFLAGAARYKTSFADHARDLVWLRLAMGHAPLALMIRARARVAAYRDRRDI